MVTQDSDPSIVEFTPEACAYCPGPIERIAQTLAASRSRTQLLVVSVDGEAEAALLHELK